MRPRILRYERLSKAAATGKPGAPRPRSPLKLIDEKDFTHRGRMDFVDNMIERASGTIRGRAEFANAARAVHPRHVRPRPDSRLAALRGVAGAGHRDRHRAGAQVRADRQGGRHGGSDLRHPGRAGRQSAGDQVGSRGRGSRHRQRDGAGATGRQGQAGGRRLPRRRRKTN